MEVDDFRPIKIITKDTGNEDAHCKVTCTVPSGRTMFLPTKKVPEGYESMFNPKEKGPHKICFEVDGKEVPKSPITTNVEARLEIKKLQVKGLEKRKFESLHLGCIVNSSLVKPIKYSLDNG